MITPPVFLTPNCTPPRTRGASSPTSIDFLYRYTQWADAWFTRLSEVHKAIDKERKDDSRPIRVALLDTGVDASHEQFENLDSHKSIKKLQGFPQSLDPKGDTLGHGTHAASVLIKTAPHAKVYIARVVDDQGKIPLENDYKAVVEVSDICYHFK